MMIFKKDHGSEAMIMYHKDIDPSGSSEDYYINMTSAGAPSYGTNVWNSTAPTKDVISLGSSGFNNDSSHDYVAYIFSSVEGFSKCGTYQGTGSTQNITGLGFKPRLLWIRQVHDGSSFNGNDFVVWTSERDNERLKFNSTSDSDTYDHIDYISDGFTVKDTGINEGTIPSTSGPYESTQRDGIEQIDGKWYTKYVKITATGDDKTEIDNSEAIAARNSRNRLLAETDYLALSDVTMSDDWKTYRQSLRDLPTASGWPHTHTWPTKPS